MTLFYGLLVSLALSFVIKEFDDHIKQAFNCSEDIKRIRRRFNIAFYILSTMAFATGFVFIIFGCVETIQRKATYMMFALPTGSCIAGSILTLTTSRTSNRRHTLPLFDSPGYSMPVPVKEFKPSTPDTGRSNKCLPDYSKIHPQFSEEIKRDIEQHQQGVSDIEQS